MDTTRTSVTPAFPYECPACKALAGQPFLAGTMADCSYIRLGLRCHACYHVWEFELPTTSLKPPSVGGRR